MDELKERESVFSNKLAAAATAESQAEAKEIAGELVSTSVAEPPAEAQPKEPDSKNTQAKETQPSQRIPWPEPVTKAPPEPGNEFVEFLKRTKRIWLIAAAAIFGLMALVTAQSRYAEWAKAKREKRHETAATSVTPDHLIARCGQPAEDVTKDLYPIILRTMSYTSPTNETMVLSFSRTAEEKSDWVFLSMKDSTGRKSYDTPETKIAALPCLDSTK